MSSCRARLSALFTCNSVKSIVRRQSELHALRSRAFYCRCVGSVGNGSKFARSSGQQLLSAIRMASTSTTPSSGAAKPNRLADEKSPYLLQHASNPVDWYPWGEEAIAKAKAEGKLIFLSVGYSTCHWCHVMEKETFENKEIAKIMNEHFVNIKVDREERPDIDRVYMHFIQATSGGGGWPMSVWLTPDLRPVVGGTYFPPDDRYFGRPGFTSLILSLVDQWKKERARLEVQGTMIVDMLRDAADRHTFGSMPSGGDPAARPSAVHVASVCFRMLERSYDGVMGGFGRAPKFPQCVNFNFLLRHRALLRHLQSGGGEGGAGERGAPARDEGFAYAADKALDMAVHTLMMMACGGIHDHIAKGFHRYSTDASWHLPHFEKMLYDQAQLARAYAEAYQCTGDRQLADVARGVLRYVDRDLSHPSGGFYSAEDADSYPEEGAPSKREGAFCVWEEAEVRRLLTEPLPSSPGKTVADVVCRFYNIRAGGNLDGLQDPHEELKHKNVLIVRETKESVASIFGLEEGVLDALLERAAETMLEARRRRPRPHLDDKFVTAWNALMISGFAIAGRILGQQAYIDRAVQGVDFLKKHLWDPQEKTLFRSAYRGPDGSVVQMERPVGAVLDDYAFTVQALLDVYEAAFDAQCLLWAEELQERQDALFWDDGKGGYFISPAQDDNALILRLKDDQDGAEGSGNSVSLGNLARLSVLLHRGDLRERADRLVAFYDRRLALGPHALPEMVCALMRLQAGPQEIVIAGPKEDPGTRALLGSLRSHFLPFANLILADQDPDNPLAQRLPNFGSYRCVDGKPTAYVCHNFACSQPVTTVEELDDLLST